MGLDFSHRIKALRTEVEALKTASRSDSDGMNTITKTINFTAHLKVYSTYIERFYFIKLSSTSDDDKLIVSVSQKAIGSSDAYVDSAVPRLENGEIGMRILVSIKYAELPNYLPSHNVGDIIDFPISINLVASDDFTYTITEES